MRSALQTAGKYRNCSVRIWRRRRANGIAFHSVRHAGGKYLVGYRLRLAPLLGPETPFTSTMKMNPVEPDVPEQAAHMAIKKRKATLSTTKAAKRGAMKRAHSA